MQIQPNPPPLSIYTGATSHNHFSKLYKISLAILEATSHISHSFIQALEKTTMNPPTGNATYPPLCVNGCGFYGSEENNNMCSKCFTHFLKTQLIDQTTKALDTLSIAGTQPSNPSVPSSDVLVEVDSVSKVINTDGFSSDSGSKLKSRCMNCNKKVGLMGFKCRCGDLFCSKHRYATEHSCTFDYKKFDREILTKENQLIKADKLAERI